MNPRVQDQSTVFVLKPPQRAFLTMARLGVNLLCLTCAVCLAFCSIAGSPSFLGISAARGRDSLVARKAAKAEPKAAKDKTRAPAMEENDADDELLYSEEDEYGDEFDEDGDFMELDGPPPEVLDGWEKDEIAMALLAQFQSEEFEGKKIMSFRDVAQLLEVLGLEREQFVGIFSGQAEEDEGFDFEDEYLDEEEYYPPRRGRGPSGGIGPGGGRGGRGRDRGPDPGRRGGRGRRP